MQINPQPTRLPQRQQDRSTSVTATAGSITKLPEPALSAENQLHDVKRGRRTKPVTLLKMLELSMDMEADLGIDPLSAEILGTA
jgi:hypothetical protein